MTQTTIVWMRNDLRIADNPALHAAASRGGAVAALYIHEQTPGVRPIGDAARSWLHQSLMALGADLAEIGIRLVVETGDGRAVMAETVQRLGADAVFWNRRYAPGERAADEAIKDSLNERGIEAKSYPGNVLVEPWDIATGEGRPYSVYSPFLKTLRSSHIAVPLPPPRPLPAVEKTLWDSEYREPKWAHKLGRHWKMGEAAAQQALADFLDAKLQGYATGRDIPAEAATSGLSPRLRFGEISPRQVWHTAMAWAHAEPEMRGFVEKFLSELAWRDFNYHQLFHREDILLKAMQPKYADMQWRDAPDELAAWQKGQTGIPIVDAGMRELWETGFMQNRVRMLAASLLTKNLLIDWRLGEAWFWDCLLDADMANNPGNWQWVAGSGLDAAPYFRIFNPVTQGEKFDRNGAYVRRWVPELAGLPDKWVHRPAEAPAEVLQRASLRLGVDYPKPIVDLQGSRERALEAMAAL